MNITFVMAYPGYLRYYGTTVRQLRERGHHVTVAFSDLDRQAEGLVALDVAAVEVPKRRDIWRSLSVTVRYAGDYLRYLEPAFADATHLRGRLEPSLPRGLRGLRHIRRLNRPTVRGCIALLRAVEDAIPTSGRIDAFLAGTQPDVLLVSPLVTAGSNQTELIKSARRTGIPTGVCVASWDHLTTKGLIRVAPDAVFVWNSAQKREAIQLHGIAPERVVVTGAQPFDEWFERAPGRDREAFCHRVGLPDTRPFVLFVGSTASISAPHAEVDFVRRWIGALRASGDPRIRDLGVVVRPHPYNLGDWPTTDLTDLGPAVVFPRHGANPVDASDRADYFDSLFHSSAVVGINTSAMIEAAIVGRPVLTILAPEFKDTQGGTLHFRYLLPENGGFLRVARRIDDSLAQLATVLDDPGAEHERTQRFVASFIRPFGLDVPATPKLVEAIERLGSTSGSRLPRRRSIQSTILRPLLWPIGAAMEPNAAHRIYTQRVYRTRAALARAKESFKRRALDIVAGKAS